MFPLDMLAGRQRHEDMLREAAENRRAHSLGAQSNTEYVLNRVTKLLSFSWLPQNRQPENVTTHPRTA